MDERDDPMQGRSRVRAGLVNLVKLLLFGVAVYVAMFLVVGVAALLLESLGLQLPLPDSD